MTEFLIKMSKEHFEGEKEQILFQINNYDYIYQNLKTLNIEKGVQDVVAIEKLLNDALLSFIKISMKENYPGLEEIVGKYCVSTDDSGSDDDHAVPQNLKKIDLT